MTIESQVPTIPTAPAEVQAEPVETTEQLEPQQQEGEATEEATEGEETPEVQPAWNSEALPEDDSFKEWHEYERNTAFRDGHIKGQQREAGQRKAIQGISTEVKSALNGINAELRKIAENGGALEPQTFQAILEQHGEGLLKVGQLGAALEEPKLIARGAIGTASTLALIATELDDPQLHKFWGRLVQPGRTLPDGSTDFEPTAEFEFDNGLGATRDFLKAVRKSIESKAEEKGYQRGLKEGKGITGEATNLEKRSGKGPASVKGSTGGKSESELLADPSTPIETIIEIRNRQKAAGQ